MDRTFRETGAEFLFQTSPRAGLPIGEMDDEGVVVVVVVDKDLRLVIGAARFFDLRCSLTAGSSFTTILR